MPFLHLDSRNLHKEKWKSLTEKDFSFEILEWSTAQDSDIIHRAYPDIDTQLFSLNFIGILAAFQKLIFYGGVVVRGEQTTPIRGLKILLEDWKSQGPPKKLTVRGFTFPIPADRVNILAAGSDDEICKLYRDKMVETWSFCNFNEDVAIM